MIMVKDSINEWNGCNIESSCFMGEAGEAEGIFPGFEVAMS
jgi:hypothetical protein